MERNIDPRSNPIVGSEVISGQITDKALALFNLLNQVTGSEGDNVKNFEIEGADPLTLALYTLEADESSHAWSPRERIYFQDNGQKLRNLQAKLRTNFDRIESDITGNINTLFKLISLSENNNTDIDGDGVIDKGVVVGDANKSILEEISAIANDSEKTNEDLENAIEELVTGETAINRLVDALFANFNLNVQRLDDEIFDLLDDGDDVFSSDNTGTDSTETTKYFLDFGDDSPAYIASSLEDAADRTLAFLESQHDGDEPWNRDTAVSNYSLGKFFNGRLLLDQGLIDAIIADDKYFSQDPDIQKEELKEIRTQRDFLTKFENSREFIDFVKNHYSAVTNDQEAYEELFKHDLAARTPKYYEDNRSLVDMLHGKADASDRSSASFIFGSLKDKITQAAGGAVQALGGGFNKLASNNFDSFVRNNPILLIEHLETEKATASEERLEEIEKEIEALTEFQKRQLDSFTTWFKEKNKDLTKAKRAIEKLEEDRIPENTLETDAKIEKILASSKDSDLSLSQNKLRIRAELAFTALQAILDEENNKDNPNSKKIETINADMELIQNTLLAGAESDIDVDQAITNGAAIAVNKAIASELKRVDPSNIADVKDLYQRYDFLELADTTGLVIDSDALSEAVEASIQSPNAHAALYASELLEAGKINARFYNRKLPEASQDGSFGEDNQLAPPQISPTTGSAALAAIGNRILSLANGVLYEADLPGKEWVQDKAQIIASIGDKISDPNLAFSSAGAVFLNQLREGFKTTIRSFFNTHSSSKNKIDDAKTVYKYIKNLKQNTEIEGAATEAMDEIEAALNWLGTEDAELATDRIFVSKPLHKSINDIRKFVNKGNLDYSDDNFTNQLNLNSLRTQLVVLYDPTGSLDTVKTKVEELEELLGTEDYETAWNNLIKEIKAELQTAYQTTKNDKVDEYLQKTDLGSIKARLEDIRDSASDDIDDLNNDIDDINRSINRLRNERSSRAGIRDNLIGLLNGENFNLSQIIDALRGEIDLDDFDLDDIDDDDEDLNLRDLISNIISNLNNRINFLNGNGSNSIRGLEDRRSAKQAEITRITSQGTRARRLLGEGSEFGIDDIIAHLDSKRADIIREIGLDPNISDSELKSELKEYRKQLNNDYAQELISSDSLATIEDQLGTVLRSTDLDLDGNSIRDEVTGELLYNGNDFLDLDKVINGVGEIADQVSTVFGQDYDKGQKLAQLEKAVVTKQVLQAELAQMIRDELDKPETGTTRAAELNQMLIPLEADIEDLGDLDEDLKVNTTQVLRQVIDTSFIGAPTSPEKIDELAKALYGFETIEDSEDIIIGSADDLKDRSLISAIDDLKVDARNILEQDLPDDDTDLVNLVNNTKDDHIGFEKQSIKRLILLMFVLSMLEYSDWDYRKQEADPSRYAVF